MNPDLTSPSINLNNKDSNQENKLQGQMLRTQELALYKKAPLNIQCAKKKEVRILRYAREAADIQRSKMQRAIFKPSKAIKELDIQYFRLPCKQYKMVGYLMENIKRLRSLQTLKLVLDWREEDLFFDIESCFICSHLHDAVLHRISHGLKRLTSLQNFSFFCTNCDMDDKRLTKICRILKRMRNLKNITLDFSECPLISDLQFQNIHSYLNQLASLKRLSFDISECRFYDKKIENLCIGLEKLTSLQNLSLNFSKCPDFTENGLHALSKCLQTMTNLTRLSLYFNNLTALSDTGLNIFAESLKKLTGLKGLYLDFTRCGNFTSIGINNLSEALMDLLCLQSNSLNFASYAISDVDVGIQKIKKSVEKLGSLKNIKIEK